MKDPEKNYGTDADESKNLPEKNYGSMESIWEDPQKVMHLIDLIFLFDDPDKEKMFS